MLVIFTRNTLPKVPQFCPFSSDQSNLPWIFSARKKLGLVRVTLPETRRNNNTGCLPFVRFPSSLLLVHNCFPNRTGKYMPPTGRCSFISNIVPLTSWLRPLISLQFPFESVLYYVWHQKVLFRLWCYFYMTFTRRLVRWGNIYVYEVRSYRDRNIGRVRQQTE